MSPRPSIITIGSFDGVHVGHAALLRRCRELAATHGDPRVVAMAFDPHPAVKLRPEAAPPRLTTWERRVELLKAAGADEVVRLEPTDELLGFMPDAFFERVVMPLRPTGVVEGPDFRFGKGRSGGIRTLQALGKGMGFGTHVVDPVEVALSDNTLARASSTMARWLVGHGRVRDAAIVLGRPYELVGEVVRGDRRGRTIGYPTANLKTACLSPADGVYAGLAHLDDGRTFAAAISVGTKPTFGGTERAVEAFLLAGEQGGAWAALPGLPEYGWRVRLEFVAWVRDQARYGTLEALLEQMDRDCRRVVELTTPRPGEGTQADGPGARRPAARATA